MTRLRDQPAGRAAGTAREAEVIVVLGAAFRRDGRVSPALDRRIRHAVRLYHGGRASWMVVTGGACGGSGKVTEAEAMARIARDGGVHASALLTEPEARNTLENARYSAAILKAHGWHRAVLVTDAFHLPRARLAFRACGIAVQGAPVPDTAPRLLPWLREAAALAWALPGLCAAWLGRR